MTLAFMNIGFPEMVVFGVIALLVFGERLPQAMQNLGRTYGRLRRSIQEATRPVREEIARAQNDAMQPESTTPYPTDQPAAEAAAEAAGTAAETSAPGTASPSTTPPTPPPADEPPPV